MGAMGTYDLVVRYPEIFAAAVPICGSVNPDRLPVAKEVKFRIFHGDADDVKLVFVFLLQLLDNDIQIFITIDVFAQSQNPAGWQIADFRHWCGFNLTVNLDFINAFCQLFA